MNTTLNHSDNTLAIRLYSVAKSVFKRCFANDLIDAVADKKLDGDIIIGVPVHQSLCFRSSGWLHYLQTDNTGNNAAILRMC
jgi:hypothetical protein